MLKIIEIEWLDHASYLEAIWRTHEELLDLVPPRVKTLGYLIEEREDAYIIASTVGKLDDPMEERSFCGEMCILKGTVLKIKELKNE